MALEAYQGRREASHLNRLAGTIAIGLGSHPNWLSVSSTGQNKGSRRMGRQGTAVDGRTQNLERDASLSDPGHKGWKARNKWDLHKAGISYCHASPQGVKTSTPDDG